jgi:hypothetical protein
VPELWSGRRGVSELSLRTFWTLLRELSSRRGLLSSSSSLRS